MTDDTAQLIAAALNSLRPLVALVSPAAAVVLGAAISVLERLLADPEPVDQQDVVTPRSDLAGLAAHDR